MSIIEKLKAEVSGADTAARNAQSALEDARSRLQQAINEESGLVGHVLEFKRSRGYGRKATVIMRRILVDRIGGRWGAKAIAFGRIVLKDGSLGVMKDDVEIDKATDLGPYVAPVDRKPAE